MTGKHSLWQPDAVAAQFLAQNGQAAARLYPLPGDASARRYIRLEGAGLLLMEDRNDPAGFDGFVRLSRHLTQLGLSAPHVVAADAATGLALIEDFGGGTYSARLAAGRDEAGLYTLAVDALLHLHNHKGAGAVAVPAFDLATLLDEVSLFAHWFVPVAGPGVDIPAFDAAFRALWADALAPLADAPETLVLRDFHVDNLMELAGRTDVRRCGLLDFQDAVSGPAEYDLVSLLQDARRDLATGLESRMLARYLDGIGPGAGTCAAIIRRYHLLGAQRHCRITGLFPRLCLRDAKPGYLVFLPRVMRQLSAALAAAELHDITAFLDQKLPAWRDDGRTVVRELQGVRPGAR